ncbi:hypothetical protein [Azovibrio restrictus]|uniref:hypothetical protein n=1 Tax=Azovibrio restrictus TaxID=146938 RepID=UPI0012EB3999|nr:hypothetical protein [Azovibrio restrictus]
MEKLLEVLNPLIQFVLVCVGLWYTVETRKLRQQSERQSKAALGQKRLSIAPYLVSGLVNPLSEDEDASESGDSAERAELKKAIEDARKNDELLYFVGVSNPTDKVAIQVDIYLYDKNKKSYLLGDTGHQVLSSKDHEIISVSRPYMTESEVTAEIKADHGLHAEFARAVSQRKETHSEIYVLYKDIEGFSYLAARQFKEEDDGDIVYRQQNFFFSGLE